MDANANNTNAFGTWTCRGRIGVKKRRHLLAEFLRKKYANAKISEEEMSPSPALIELQNDATTILELNDDLLFKIVVLLPSESLVKLQFVCKKWFGLINSSVFITFHARNYSETVLISQKLTHLEPRYSSPDLPLQSEDEKAYKSYFHVLNLDHRNNSFIESSVDNLVEILATYEGLVLATKVDNNGNKSLILMNPLTRKHTPIPLGMFVSNSRDESYGIAFCNEANLYKLVHFFCERRAGGVYGSEILNISTRKWTRIEGPREPELLRNVKWRFLVSMGGSLYWIPRRRGCDYFVSMNVTNEEFRTENLPVCCGLKDRLVDVGGFLGFVARAGVVGVLQVWILMNMNDVNWVKRYSINMSIVEVRYPIPICSLRNGKGMVFESPRHRLYAYSFDDGEMKLMVHSGDDDGDGGGGGMWFRGIHQNYIPHRNTLASWEDLDHDKFRCSRLDA